MDRRKKESLIPESQRERIYARDNGESAVPATGEADYRSSRTAWATYTYSISKINE